MNKTDRDPGSAIERLKRSKLFRRFLKHYRNSGNAYAALYRRYCA